MAFRMRKSERLLIPFFMSVPPLQVRTAPPMVNARTTLLDDCRRVLRVVHSRVNYTLSFSPLPPLFAVFRGLSKPPLFFGIVTNLLQVYGTS